MLPENPSRPTPDWEAIRHEYADTARCVEDICIAHGVSRRTLYRRLAKEGWPLRQLERARRAAASEEGLAARLIAALDRKTRKFEKRLRRAAEADSAADSERDARTLNMLVRLFEKLSMLQASAAAFASGGTSASACSAPMETDRGSSSSPSPQCPRSTGAHARLRADVLDGHCSRTPTKEPHDQERLRGELARRLDRLRAQIGG